jgi:transposase
MKISTIGLDLAKNVFAVHGIEREGRIGVKRNLRRAQVLPYFAKLEPCLVGMEASAGAHYWARELTKLGHDVRLMPAGYVKPYVKRGKTDAGDAEAICEAVQRPTMRFVPVKTEAQQGLQTLHRSRSLLLRQRTQTINVLRALCAEFGVIAAKGRLPLGELIALVGAEDDGRIPAEARLGLTPLLSQLELLSGNIAVLDRQIGLRNKNSEESRRLLTIPGVGPLFANALPTAIGDVKRFTSGRDLAAWIGLTPKAHSSGGKDKLGHISKQGNGYLRRLLVQGAMALIRVARTSKRPVAAWLRELLARKPAKVAAIALANKIARIAWAVLTKGEDYRVQSNAAHAA